MNRRDVLRLSVMALAVAGTATLAGCGVPIDGQPRDVAEPDQPFAIGPPDAAPDSASSSSDPVVYFLTPRPTERLIAAHRPVHRTADELMTALLGKLTTAEMAANLRTAIPNNVTFDGTAPAPTDAGTIVVKLIAPKDGANFLQGEDGVRAAAQIVYTMSSVAQAVQVEVNGELQKLLAEDGTVLNRPAVEGDYRSYDPNTPITTPTTLS